MKLTWIRNGKTKLALAKVLVLAFGSIGASSLSHASPITYTINRTNSINGLTGSLTGTITTDGTFGLLTGANFLSVNLIVSSGLNSYAIVGNTYSLNPPSGTPSLANVPIDVNNGASTGLQATATQLTFDASFSSSNPEYKSLQIAATLNSNTSAIYCLATLGLSCVGEGFAQMGLANGNRTFIPQPTNGFGVITLGTVVTAPPPPSGVPEPGVSLLVLTGLSAIWLRRRRS